MTSIGVWKNPTRDHRLRLRGPRGGRRNLHRGERELNLRRLRVGICRRADPVIVLLRPSPKREHFKIPFRIRRHEHFFSDRLVDTSHLRRLFHSLLLLFPTRFFRPFSPRFGVGGFTFLLFDWPLLGHLRISIPVPIYGMHGIIVDNDGFPLPLTSLERQGHTERSRALLCGLLVRWMLEGGRKGRESL